MKRSRPKRIRTSIRSFGDSYAAIAPWAYEGGRRESNPQPADPHSAALPIKLRPQYHRWGSNPWPSAYEADALPAKLRWSPEGWNRTTGPPHIRRTLCLLSYFRKLAPPAGFEPAIFRATAGWNEPLSYEGENRNDRIWTCGLLIPNQASCLAGLHSENIRKGNRTHISWLEVSCFIH